MKGTRSVVLQRRVRILCWVMTANGTSNKLKALAVKRTWGRRCQRILFFAEIAGIQN
jgi:glycoprotein-N-acetylgalactosamine 3-beta-galactosyltransferase